MPYPATDVRQTSVAEKGRAERCTAQWPDEIFTGACRFLYMICLLTYKCSFAFSEVNHILWVMQKALSLQSMLGIARLRFRLYCITRCYACNRVFERPIYYRHIRPGRDARSGASPGPRAAGGFIANAARTRDNRYLYNIDGQVPEGV